MKKLMKTMFAAALSVSVLSTGMVFCVSAADSETEAVESEAEAVESGAENAAFETETADGEDEVYTAFEFLCLDDEADPVAGVRLDVCTDIQCFTLVSDAEGRARLNVPEDADYTVHVITIPDGYGYENETEFMICGPYQEIDITLYKDHSGDPDYSEDGLKHGTLSFTTVDLEGNEVTSEELFADYDLILINLWEDWCKLCVQELPGLESIYEANADRKIGVIGVVDPYENETSSTERVKELIAENGITYPVIKRSDDFDFIDNNGGGRPMTFFVDHEGNIIPITDDSLVATSGEEYGAELRKNIEADVARYNAGELEDWKTGTEYEQEKYAWIKERAEDPDSIETYIKSIVKRYISDGLDDGYGILGDYGEINSALSEEKLKNVVEAAYASLTSEE